MNSALLVIDMQNEYFAGGARPVSYPAGSLENILRAMDSAHEHNLPIAVIQHASPKPDAFAFRRDTQGWELRPEIAARPSDILIHKNYPGSFTNTPLEEWLKAIEIDAVTICGYMTQMCCDTTARQAFHRGYRVNFLSDATGTLDLKNTAGTISAEELHKATLIVQQSAFSRVITTADWIAEL